MADPNHSNDALRLLHDAFQRPESELDPAHLALLVAQGHFPGLVLEPYFRLLDQFAERIQSYIGRGRSPVKAIAAINRVLFDEEGFRGNVEDYYNPANSYLNEVLDRRTGIPITLSLIYLAIGFRLKLPVQPVGLPLHFIVKFASVGGSVFVDPFHHGQILTVQDCQKRVEGAAGAPVEFRPEYLNSISMRQVIYRLLNNLKMIYLRQEDHLRAGAVVDQMLVVQPDMPGELRDRGLLHMRTGEWRQAHRLLARYVSENADAEDAAAVRAHIDRINRRWARLN